MKKIIFVCTGNICRSPMAEALFRHLLGERDDFEIVSAGISAMPGEAASRHTQEILDEQEIDLSAFRSQPLTEELALSASHIFTMTSHHLEAINHIIPKATPHSYLVTEFCEEDRIRDRDVPDPIGQGRSAYEATYRTLRASLPSLIKFIEQTASDQDTAMPTAANEASTTNDSSKQEGHRIIIGADHGGLDLKNAVVDGLKKAGHEVKDIGTHDGDSVDYPDFADQVSLGVLSEEFTEGILVCTTGIGMSISANRHPGIQAALVTNAKNAAITRQHNNTNVLCLSNSDTTPEEVAPIVDAWLAASFEGGRHARRVGKTNPAPGKPVAIVDPEIAQVLQIERQRQNDNIELIASENFTSRAVMEVQGSCLTNKYAEGYPGRRWYGGCEHVDVAETLAIERCKELFGAEFANVQPHSGSQANAAVYFSVLKPGDKILTMDLSHGGHLTHGHPANFSGKFYEVQHYGVDQETGTIDYDLLQKAAEEFRPAMITAGASAYPRIIDFERMGQIAKSVDALLFVDMAHIAGLVAGGVHPSPVGHADYITSTTHKSLRGPRGGIILTSDEERAKKIDNTVFPGVQGGPLMHVIAAKAVCFHEGLQDGFKEYQEQIVSNAQALASSLSDHGYALSSGGTDNHLMLVDVRPQKLNGKIAQHALDEAGITVNKNSIPFDTESPFKGGGIRIGTPAVTTRGMKEAEMQLIADWIHGALSNRKKASKLAEIRQKVRELNADFPLPG